MTVLVVPKYENKYPTLGYQVISFIEDLLVYGPGDLLGLPVVLDDEKKALICRMYEVFPQGHRNQGRRRFKRCALSLRKGTAKTELAAMIAAVELHPDGPVRCDGFDSNGYPVGVGVKDPYIPLVAYTEEQSDELAYGALKTILEYSPIADDFDIGLMRIMRKDGNGKAVSLSSSPDARDGARTTFSVMDETHRWSLPRLKNSFRTMLANLPKRKLADSWNLEVTTAFSPGENSVAEDTMNYATQVDQGLIKDSRLFFFHRQASDKHDLTTNSGIRSAIIEASGSAAEWSDVDGIAEQFNDPTQDRSYLERVWLNRLVRSSERAFDVLKWNELKDEHFSVPFKSLISIGFDGAKWRDSTAVVCTHVVTGYQWLAGLWEKPLGADDWEVPTNEVNAVIDNLFNTYCVYRLYADPPYWESLVSEWSGKYGEKKVFEWWTNRPKVMAYSIQSFNNAILSGDILHSGDENVSAHLGNAYRKDINVYDENGKRLWVIYKERPDSPHKIDAAMASVLSWQARNDAIADGLIMQNKSAYEKQGLMAV